VGVNSRDLASFREDLDVGARLAARIPSATVAVAESAVRSDADARRMAAAGSDAVLVGEALVRSHDPESVVRAMSTSPVDRSAR
jgi:indole-3-glycerol phosphate synthase